MKDLSPLVMLSLGCFVVAGLLINFALPLGIMFGFASSGLAILSLRDDLVE